MNNQKINLNNMLTIRKKDESIDSICNINKIINKYDLVITKEDAKQILITRNNSLTKYERIEFKESIIKEIIVKFAPSPFIMKDNFIETINKLVEIFYEYKNETNENIGDSELIDVMKYFFDNKCKGSLEYLEGTILYSLSEKIKADNGYISELVKDINHREECM